LYEQNIYFTLSMKKNDIEEIKSIYQYLSSGINVSYLYEQNIYFTKYESVYINICHPVSMYCQYTLL
jgi:hypothetical protein